MSTDESRKLEIENAVLREQLAEAEGTLHAIRRGEIDAVVVATPHGERVFTLEGADHVYRMLVESMNEGAATVTSDGEVMYANRRLAAMLAVTTTQLTGKSLKEWVGRQDTERLMHLIRTSVDGSASGELTLVTASGETIPVLASFSTFPLHDERLYCVVITDLSLAKHHAAVEAAAQQVREANDRLRKADHRKDEFLATLAHELRNPLAPIRSAAQVLPLIEHADERLRRVHDIIERQVTHMVRLIDDLLEVSRVALGRIELRRRPEDLGSLLRDIVDATRSMIEPKQQFIVDIMNESLVVDVDATRLLQAISNILDNAKKYTPEGGSILLHAQREGDEAVVFVEDTGIGMETDLIPAVFDMFVQGNDNAQQGQTGLGIGLALARRLIEMHRGQIEAASAGPGSGTRVTIRLPLVGDAAAGLEPPTTSASTVVPPQGVLIVDDNVDAAESMRTLLQLSGHSARAVHDGRTALQALREFLPDMVLLDIGLPDLDGYEVARQIRGRYGAACPMLVAVSGWGQDADKQRATEAGIDAYFTKPINPTALARMLAESKDRKRVSGRERI